MYSVQVRSDQLYTWSEICVRENLFCFAKTPPISSAPIPPARGDPTWLAHRALQTVWQARLQMCQGSGTRSQVLPVGKLPGLSTSHGLCAARAPRSDRRIPRQLPTNPRDSGGNLRDQPRTTTTSRGALRSRNGRCTLCTHRTVGSGNRRRSSGEHARSLARRRSQCLESWRGQ